MAHAVRARRCVVGALWLFILALQLIKTGAGGLKPVLDSVSADGVARAPRLRLARLLRRDERLARRRHRAEPLRRRRHHRPRDLRDDQRLALGRVAHRAGRRLRLLRHGPAQPGRPLHRRRRAAHGDHALGAGVPIGLFVLDQGWLDGVAIRQPRRADLVRRLHLRPGRRPAGRRPAAARALRRRRRRADRRLHALRPRAAQPRSARPAHRGASQALQQRYAMFAFGTL